MGVGGRMAVEGWALAVSESKEREMLHEFNTSNELAEYDRLLALSTERRSRCTVPRCGRRKRRVIYVRSVEVARLCGRHLREAQL